MTGRWEGTGPSAKVNTPTCQSGLREACITEALRSTHFIWRGKSTVKAKSKHEETCRQRLGPSLSLIMFDCLVKHSVGLAPLARGKHWEKTWHRAMYLGLVLKAEGWMNYLPGTVWLRRRRTNKSLYEPILCKEKRAQQRSPIKGHRDEKEGRQGSYRG